ncbi:MAG: hypothetical protein GY788_30660 [bacterium]|nr:hypothetical protein [bacterium]
MPTDPDGEATRTAVDVRANRASRKWSRREQAGRVLWELLRRPLFNWTPRPLWAWRRAVLRLFGARIGGDVHVHPTVTIAVPWNLTIKDYAALGDGVIVYNLGAISIGENATVSQFAHLCAGSHDYRRLDMALLKPPITIGADCWICAEAFVGPGVAIGDGAVVGARAVAMRDVGAWTVVAGNPATKIADREVHDASDARRSQAPS